MDLIVNSLYSNREVFLRELVSNASDALDKLRFLSLTDPGVMGPSDALEIRIRADADAKTITIECARAPNFCAEHCRSCKACPEKCSHVQHALDVSLVPCLSGVQLECTPDDLVVMPLDLAAYCGPVGS